jgi:hypothetical protein
MLVVYSSPRDFAAYVDRLFPPGKKILRSYSMEVVVHGKEPKMNVVVNDDGPFNDDRSNDSSFAQEIAENAVEDVKEILEDFEPDSDEELDIVSDTHTLSIDSQASTTKSEPDAVFTDEGDSNSIESVSPTSECHGDETADPYSWFVPRHPDEYDTDDTSGSAWDEDWPSKL